MNGSISCIPYCKKIRGLHASSKMVFSTISIGISIFVLSFDTYALSHSDIDGTEKVTTGGSPLTPFSLPWIPLKQYLAYERASGGFLC